MVICCDAFGNKKEVDNKQLELCASVYGIIVENNKILLTKQWDGYSLPGGGVKLGETLAETFKREIKEETGLNVEIGDIIHCESNFYNHKNKAYYHSILMYYTHSSLSGEISIDNITNGEKEYVSGKAEWVDIDKLDDIVFRHTCDLKMILNKINRL